MSQNTFNNIMYTIIGVVLLVMLLLGLKPAWHQTFYENYEIPAQQAHQIQSQSKPDTSYLSFSQFN